MYIEIHLSTEDELNEQSRAVLLALAGVTETLSGVLMAEEAKSETPKKRAPRKPKTDPGPTELGADGELEKATAEAAAEEQDAAKLAKGDEPEEEPAPEALNQSVHASTEKIPTLNEVANVATAFIRNGKRDEVAKILNEDLGVEKVTALKDSPEKVPELFDRLVDLYNVQNPASRKAIRQQINEDTAPLFLARIEG